MNPPSCQILLKSTSSMSLDERFTMMLRNRQASLTDIRDTVHQPLSASSKNQLLAQQMASRPSVLAALQNKLHHQFKGSVKARLGRPMMRGSLYGMSRCWGRPRGRGVLFRGALSQRLPNRSLIEQQYGHHISRRGLRGGLRTQSGGLRGDLRGKAGRGMLLVGRGSAGSSARPGSRPIPTREELDAQLDDYMSMTKSQLDAQLDAYMAEVDSEAFTPTG